MPQSDPFAAYQKPLDGASDPFAAYQVPAGPGRGGSIPKASISNGQAKSSGWGPMSASDAALLRGQASSLEGMTDSTSMPREDNPYGKYVMDNLAGGVSDIRAGNYSRGAHQVIKGAGAVAAPFALPFVASAPVAAATTAALGYGGGKLARGAASLFNATPDQQDVAEDAGNVLGGAFGPKLAGSDMASDFAHSARTAMRNVSPFRVNPTFATARALGGGLERVPDTIAMIKGANPGFRPSMSAEGKLNIIPAANRAADIYRDALEPWHQRLEGQTMRGIPMIDATHEGINELLPSEQQVARVPFTSTGKSLISRATQDYDRPFTSRELQKNLETLNARMSPFYNASDASQGTALAEVPMAVLKRQRDANANMLYNWMDPENEGAGPREIQAKRGDLINFASAGKRYEPGIAAQQPLTTAGRLIDPLRGMIQHFIPGRAAGIASMAEGAQGRSLPNLRKAFGAVDETPGVNEIGRIPRPVPIPAAQHLLSAPARQMPGVPDDGGPVYNSRNGPQRLLPAPPSNVGGEGGGQRSISAPKPSATTVPPVGASPAIRSAPITNKAAAPAEPSYTLEDLVNDKKKLDESIRLLGIARAEWLRNNPD